jgi:hypothetical protein
MTFDVFWSEHQQLEDEEVDACACEDPAINLKLLHEEDCQWRRTISTTPSSPSNVTDLSVFRYAWESLRC